MSATPEVNKQTMMYYTALFAALLSAFVGAKEIIDPSKCAAELQGALFEPQTYAKDYMQKVAANFKIGSALLFSPNANSYINSFENEWGVTVSINDALNICGATTENTCYSTVVNDPIDPNPGEYTFSITDDIVISSLNISITGAAGGDGGLGTYTLTSPANSAVLLSDTNICGGTSTDAAFSIGFADGSTETITCSPEGQNAGTVLAPTNSLSNLNGESTLGDWLLTVTGAEVVISSITLNYCSSSSSTSCSRDVMKALTNIPGFRFDSATQTVYYTEDIFDQFGNFKQVTISRPINGIYLKK